MSEPDHMPQWRALAGAKAIVGDLAKVWKDGRGRFFVGMIEDAKIITPKGRRPMICKGVRVWGSGTSWKAALQAAAAYREAHRIGQRAQTP